MKRDLRRYAKNTTVRVVFGFIILLFVVGDGLIYMLYGPAAAVTGILCILGGILPIILIYGALWILELIVNKANE